MSKLAKVQPAELKIGVRPGTSVDLDGNDPKLKPNKSLSAPSRGVQIATVSKGPGNNALKGSAYLSNSLKDRLIDVICFICPDCSCVQYSAIFIGLLIAALLTLFFLYLGGYFISSNIAARGAKSKYNKDYTQSEFV